MGRGLIGLDRSGELPPGGVLPVDVGGLPCGPDALVGLRGEVGEVGRSLLSGRPITSSTILPNAPPVASGSTKAVPFAPGGGHTPSSWKIDPESEATRVRSTDGTDPAAAGMAYRGILTLGRGEPVVGVPPIVGGPLASGPPDGA